MALRRDRSVASESPTRGAVPTLLLVLALGWPAGALSALPGVGDVAAVRLAAAVQDEPDPDELALDVCDSIKEAVKDYQPLRLETALRRLDELYDAVTPKTLKKVDKAILSVFKLKPRRPDIAGEDTREELVEAYLLAIGVVYDEESGPGLLQQALKQSHVKDWTDVQSAIVEGLGYRKDPKLIGLLTDYLEGADAVVAGAAARALAQYSENPQEERRQIVVAMLEIWEEYAEAADKEIRRDKEERVARDALADVEGPFGLALVKLTRQDHPDVVSWRTWFDGHGADSDW